jgi:hypothetical protein
MSISVFIALVILGAGEEINQPKLYFEKLYEPIRNLQMKYEGNDKQFYPQENIWRTDNEFSGSFVFKSGLSLKSESINNKFNINLNRRETIRRSWSLNQGKGTEYTIAPNGLETYDFSEQRQLIEDLTRVYATGCDIFPVPQLMSMASSPDRRFYRTGTEKIGENLCEVISSPSIRKEDGKLISTEKLWLDLRRGGFPLKYEQLDFNDELKYRIDEIELKQFPGGDSKNVWLPISARHQSFITSTDLDQEETPPIYKRGDVYRIRTNRVLFGSVHVNEVIKDDVFVLRRRNGERITEKNAKVTLKDYRAKNPRKSMTSKEAEAILDQKLKAGEDRQNDIIANSVARNGDESNTKWLRVGLGISGFLFLFIAFRLKKLY